MQGFKSFIEKTIIDFPVGITAIVGPNGSGKSNIMDAMRWVFGEQRASELRGGEMDDIIFAGSEKRRPASFAEVALTIGDLPAEISGKWGTFSEITVTRKIYRNGEREYLINGKRCRLKDIRDIFYDTGLGTRSISIIEQERVTKIVNSTPEELRYFLEETAGVIRYKERKKDAEIRLKQAYDNLSRINDILSVMSAGLERLSAQTEQVKRYRELKSAKEEYEKALICVSYAKLFKDKEQYLKTVSAYRDEIAALVTENQSRIELEMSVQNKLDLSRGKLKEQRKVYDLTKETLTKAEGDIVRIDSNIGLAAKQEEQIAEDLKKSALRKDEISKRIEDIKTSLDDVKKVCDELSEKTQERLNSASEHKSMVESAQDELKRIKRKDVELIQQLTDCSNRLNLKNAEIISHKNSTVRLKREREELSQESSAFALRFERGKAELTALESALVELKKSAVLSFNALQERDQELNDLQKQRSAKEVKLNTIDSQINYLQNEINSKAAGGAQGREFIKRFGGELFTDAALDDDAFLLYGDIILFSDETRELLLNELSGADISLRFVFKSDTPALQNGSDILKVGECLYRQGVIYRKIGSDDPQMELMRLQQNLQNEQKVKETVFTEIKGNDERIAAVGAQVEALRNDYQKKSDSIKSSELNYSSMLTNVAHLEEQKQRMGRNIAVIEKEISFALDSAAFAEKEAEELRKRQVTLTEKQKELDAERSSFERKAEDLAGRLEKTRDEHAALSRELAKYSERKSALESESVRYKSEINEILSSIENLNERINKLAETRSGEWKQERETAVVRKSDASKQIILISDSIRVIESEQIEAEGSLAELRAALHGINNALHEIDKKLSDQLGKAEGVKAEMDELARRLFDCCGEDIDLVWQVYANKGVGARKLQDEINTVTAEIDALGPLNMAAEEEYETENRKYNEQNLQRRDIERSIESINDLISEIDDNSVQLFMETFKAVSGNFIAVFERFFGKGGSSSGYAELRLTEPENLLTTGVELSLTPPGKKINNKNLLSGGEKALAALTLLFALFLQKPTPFCFLDEVDAPLDDANVARFIDMVHSLADSTQFVIITHKYQTMAAADSLYGVTMQEGGVSSMLSVELKGSN